jgi:hypothetical protein
MTAALRRRRTRGDSLRSLVLGLLLAALAMPTTAGASHSSSVNPPGDLAAGGGAFAVPGDPEASFRFSVGARSGPLGERPRGHLRISAFDIVDADPANAEAFTVNGRVECLLVTGRTAVIGAVKRRFVLDGLEYVHYNFLLLFDTKRADVATVVGVEGPAASLPASEACQVAAPTNPPVGFFPMFRGNVVVHDAQ